MNMSHAVLGNKQGEECVCSHILKIPGRPLFDPQVFIDPLNNPINPQGSISTTLGTPSLTHVSQEDLQSQEALGPSVTEEQRASTQQVFCSV